ncbi:hypothetical protein ABIA22_000336 [Sinorhizobium fredii]|uniref:hypothetical protein n=1 Tax=Rhizobium fredii TaxID=380 RepID=UPI003518A8F7
MWEKLAWDIDVFEDIQRSYPNEKQPLAYAAINVCIAAESLGDWVGKIIGSRSPTASEPPWDRIRDHLASRVPQLNMCKAIANTAKHHNFREGRWIGGRVDLVWEEGDEYGPPGFALYHIDDNGQSMTLAFNSFQALKEAWWNALTAEGLAEGRMPTPEWMQNKLRRIFGGVIAKLPAHTLHPLPQGYPHAEHVEEQEVSGENSLS